MAQRNIKGRNNKAFVLRRKDDNETAEEYGGDGLQQTAASTISFTPGCTGTHTIPIARYA